ncbi:hypothetical protein [Calycomorphotria hydatis]|uniref:Chromosome partition protein Smc n=1 Tax=Calycomorphotria hydatis TaxID=2528027 RepID=A0A517TAX6_9PLAN|nr:hypothetical protein [Calycomorphotria hydatis]QDT65526.1 hypothetical protein V22_27810 [Calycomorphotria hydatis]
MTYVGKLLVVLQLMLSVCFMAFAGAVYTTQQNWQAAATKAQEDVASLRENLATVSADLTNRVTEEKTRADKAEQERDLAQGKLDDSEVKVEQVTEKLNTAQTALEVQTTLAGIAEDQAAAARKQASTLRGLNSQLLETKDELTAENRKLEDQIFSLKREADRIEQKHQSILNRNVELIAILQANGLSSDPSDYANLDTAPPPVVEGLVLNVAKPERRGGSEFVDVSLGSDDGLKKGHTLYVYNNKDGGTYLGQIQLTDVAADRAVGKVIQKSKNGSIERGDNVTSKL